MANSGASNSNGSRFFIILGDLTDDHLPPDYTLFGEVLVLNNGEQHKPTLTTIEKFNAVVLSENPGSYGEVSLPVEPITIRQVSTGTTLR